MESVARTIFLIVAAILVIGLVAQVFLAGLGVFAGSSNFLTHRDTGYMLSILPLVLIIAGLIGGVGRRLVLMSLAVGLLFLLQSVFVGIRSDYPSLAALHAVNGFLILLLSIVIVRDAWLQRRTSATLPEPEGPGERF